MVDQEHIGLSGAGVPLVAVLSNLKSTTNERGMDKLCQVIQKNANIVHFEIGEVESIHDAIDEALELFAKAQPHVLVVNGGDGTIGLVFQALLNRNPFSVIPPLALLAGGKTNMTASDLGYIQKPHRMLQSIIKVAQRGHIPHMLTNRHIIELDMGDGGEVHCGTFFGGAGVVKGIYWCRENAYARGLPNVLAHIYSFVILLCSAMGLGGGNILKSDKMDISVAAQGRLGGHYTAVLVTTLDKLLFGLKPYGMEGRGGLRFSAITSGGRNTLRAIRGLITKAYGKKTIGGVHVRRGDLIRIKTTDPVTLDGEIYHPLDGVQMILKGDRKLAFLDMKAKVQL